MIEVKSVYLFFTVNTYDMSIVECDGRPEFSGTSFPSFFRALLSDRVLGPMEAMYTEETVEKFIREEGNGRMATYYAVNGNFGYRFSACSVSEYAVSLSVSRIDGDDMTARDALTAVYTRGYIVDFIERALRERKKGALLLVDLDNFKQINDTHGHASGDVCLKKIAAEISAAAGKNVVGRYGGDEFLIWAESPDENALNELYASVMNITYAEDGADPRDRIDVTCSCGAAFAPSDGKTFTVLFEAADKALYRAKNAGRHAIFVSGKGLRKNGEVKASPVKKLRTRRNSRLFWEQLRRIKLRNVLSAATAAVLATTVGGFAVSLLNRHMTDYVDDNAYSIMENFSVQISSAVVGDIGNWFSQLRLAQNTLQTAFYAEANDEAENPAAVGYAYSSAYGVPDSLLDLLIAENNEIVSFSRIGLLFESGELYLGSHEDGTPWEYSISGEDVAETIIVDGKEAIGKIYVNNIGDRIVFGIPVEEGYTDESGRAVAGIMGVSDIDYFSGLLDTDIFESSAAVLIIRADGARIVNSSNFNETGEMPYNIFNSIRYLTDETTFENFREAIRTGKSGVTEFVGQFSFLTYYAPLSASADNAAHVSDWRLVIMVPTEAISHNMDVLLVIARIILFALICLLAASILITFIGHGRLTISNNLLRYLDPLTGDINKARFDVDAELLLKSEKSYALAFFNVAQFKYINEQFGRAAADDMLRKIFGKLSAYLDKDELITRNNADRFLLLLSQDLLSQRVDSMVKSVADAEWFNGAVSVKLNVGVYLLPPDSNILDAVDKVQTAENLASQQGETSVVFYDDSFFSREKENADLEQRKELALKKEFFEVWYQPKWDLQRDRWCGAEALVRWNDPTLGMISPGKFIPLFEKDGFITELDKYVFRRVLGDIKELMLKGRNVSQVSVNLSRKHLLKENFLDEYEIKLKEYGVPPRLIEFELTESFVAEDDATLKKLIDRIHDMGCECSIDDFGSGYSSLNMLTQLRFDKIKFDRKFFNGENGFDDNARQVVATMISLSHKLGKTVIAEGIETEDQVLFLKNVACDSIQGFYFAKPMPRDNYLAFVE